MINHMSKRARNEARKFFGKCGEYVANDNLNENEYKQLREEGVGLKKLVESIKKDVRSEKAKKDNQLFIDDVNYALEVIHKHKKI